MGKCVDTERGEGEDRKETKTLKIYVSTDVYIEGRTFCKCTPTHAHTHIHTQ